MKPTVTLIPGDGIGPEVAHAAVQVLAAAGAEVEWEEVTAQPIVEMRPEEADTDPVLRSSRKNRVGLKGPTTTPVGTGHRSINVALRKMLNLYANLRPVKNLPGVRTPFQDVDLVILRENTEGLYSGLEHVVVPGVVESLKIITAQASSMIALFAFEYARKYGRKKVTAVHKANIMKLSDGLFLDSARRISKAFSDIEYNEVIVDNCCMQLVMRPQQFDVLLLENLYGDIVSDLCAGLVGGLGLVPGANLGEHCALFEAAHGSAPDIAGKNLANPTAMLQSAVLMLRHLEQQKAANRVERGIWRVYQEGRHITHDVGGKASTDEFTAAVVDALGD
jgi:isocitrate dehydrogenase (NAD+)